MYDTRLLDRNRSVCLSFGMATNQFTENQKVRITKTWEPIEPESFEYETAEDIAAMVGVEGEFHDPDGEFCWFFWASQPEIGVFTDTLLPISVLEAVETAAAA